MPLSKAVDTLPSSKDFLKLSTNGAINKTFSDENILENKLQVKGYWKPILPRILVTVTYYSLCFLMPFVVYTSTENRLVLGTQ